MNLSKEQHEAREYISLYEGGSTLTCEMAGPNLWIESDSGKTWIVYPEGRIVREPHGEAWATDLTDLTNRVESPSDYEPCEDDRPPADDLMGLGPVSDFHSDRLAEMRDERQKIEDDQRYYRERGEVA